MKAFEQHQGTLCASNQGLTLFLVDLEDVWFEIGVSKVAEAAKVR